MPGWSWVQQPEAAQRWSRPRFCTCWSRHCMTAPLQHWVLLWRSKQQHKGCCRAVTMCTVRLPAATLMLCLPVGTLPSGQPQGLCSAVAFCSVLALLHFCLATDVQRAAVRAAAPAGTQHALSFQELQQRYAHLPPNALSQLLSQLLERRRAEAPQPVARGLTSLLEAGTLSVLEAGSTAGANSAVVGAASLPPVWLRPGRALLSEPHRLLLLRQAGLLRCAQHPCVVQPPEVHARQLAHAITVRGHRYAVYCVTFDRTGRYLVTGSDDRLVKASVLTQDSGREHGVCVCV